MESMAQPGMIFLTEATHAKIGSTVPCNDCGERSVKGQRQPLRVYMIVDESHGSAEMLEQADEFRREMGIAEPASTTSPLPTAQAAPATGPTEAMGAQPAVTAPIETPDACADAVRASVMAAVEWYKKGVYLGRPRNAEVEAWFTRFVRELQHRL